ncbi:RipA family octameric membrane protein [Thermomonas fusca]
MDYKHLIWDHFKFNAEQRLKAFNFFLLLSIFANGGVITALEKKLSPVLLVLIGLFLILLSVVFWLADARSKALLWLSVESLREIELDYPEKSQIFRLDAERRGGVVRYSTAITALLVAQLVFGIGVVWYGASRWWC